MQDLAPQSGSPGLPRADGAMPPAWGALRPPISPCARALWAGATCRSAVRCNSLSSVSELCTASVGRRTLEHVACVHRHEPNPERTSRAAAKTACAPSLATQPPIMPCADASAAHASSSRTSVTMHARSPRSSDECVRRQHALLAGHTCSSSTRPAAKSFQCHRLAEATSSMLSALVTHLGTETSTPTSQVHERARTQPSLLGTASRPPHLAPRYQPLATSPLQPATLLWLAR